MHIKGYRCGHQLGWLVSFVNFIRTFAAATVPNLMSSASGCCQTLHLMGHRQVAYDCKTTKIITHEKRADNAGAHACQGDTGVSCQLSWLVLFYS